MLNEISKSKVSRYSLLRHKKYRDMYGLFLVQGHKAVADTIGAFHPEALIVRQDSDITFNLGFGLPLHIAKDSDIKKISTLETIPDVIAVYQIPKKEEISNGVNPGEFYLVLDGVQDPGNMGTIIRTAHWFGIKRIFCSPTTADVFNPKVVQATMGSLGKVEICYLELQELFDNNKNIPIYGLQLNGENIFGISNPTPGFIVMGNEGNGISDDIKSRVTRSITIPPADPLDHPESLNVSIATAITLSQFLR